MKAKIQEILQRQAKKNSQDVQTSIIYINKPEFVECDFPIIRIDDPMRFYTFDGRTLIFTENQTEPIISLPDETRDCLSYFRDDILYLFLLSSRGKLECCQFTNQKCGERYCITRNVVQIIKDRSTIYYLFKKDTQYYINEIVYDGSKWLGKQVITGIKADHVKLFSSQNLFYLLKDGDVCDISGVKIENESDFIYSNDTGIVIGKYLNISSEAEFDDFSERHMEYSLKLCNSQMHQIDSISFKFKNVAIIKAFNDYIVMYESQVFRIVKIEEFGLKIIKTAEINISIYAFDIYASANILSIYCLTSYANSQTNENAAEMENKIAEQDVIECSLSVDPFITVETEEAIVSEPLEAIDVAVQTNIDDVPVEQNEQNTNEEQAQENIKPKNALLDSVRETLNNLKIKEDSSEKVKVEQKTTQVINKKKNEQIKKSTKPSVKNEKESSDSELEETLEDRFARYMKEEKPANEAASKNQSLNKSKNNNSVNEEQFTSREVIDQLNALDVLSKVNDAPKTSPQRSYKSKLAMQESANKKESVGNSLDKNLIESIVSQTMDCVKSKNEEMIKEVILKHMVPAVEAAFNEMRIQMIAEIKKMSVSGKYDLGADSVANIRRHFDSGKTEDAFREMVALSDNEFDSAVSFVMPGMIECINSNLLVLLIAKTYNLLKRKYKDSYIRLIYDILQDIEIGELTPESQQKLSITLRYLRELNGLDVDESKNLICLIDFVMKKLRRRVNSR